MLMIFLQFWLFSKILTISDNFRQSSNIFLQFWQFLTIDNNFDNSGNCFCHFDNWKGNPGDLWHLRHWLQFWQLRTWIHDNLCYLTINCDTGQHSQFLRCFVNCLVKVILNYRYVWMFECKCGNLFERESVWAAFLPLLWLL